MRIAVFPLALAIASCGGKTGLGTGDGGGPRLDAGIDPRLPRLPDGAVVDAAACPEPCDDGVFCNGREFCNARTGRCERTAPPSCDDGHECTVDHCDPEADRCVHVEMDRDEDGDGVSACAGDCDDEDASIHPGAMEACDGLDNDCDGRVDEGVRSECGDCRAGCHLARLPAEGEAWDLDEAEASRVEVGPDGRLTLDSTRSENAYAWIANTLYGTLTKLDTRTGEQVAEYDTALLDGTTDAAPPGEQCQQTRRGGNCPSRTAVDLDDAVYVANRAFFGQGTVTKIAGFESDCIDRNGNGEIDTSRDVDGDGVIDPDVPGEYLGQDDECLLWTVDVGNVDGVPRAIAVDAEGKVWVGLNKDMRVLQLSPDDGRVLHEIPFTFRRRFRPYGAAIDSEGRLWLTEAGTGRLIGVDTESADVIRERTASSRAGCSGSYGIAVDDADRVWLAGFHCPVAFRYDPDDDLWMEVDLPDSGAGRGIAADDRGFVYMAASHEWISIDAGGLAMGPETARVTRFRADDGGDVTIWGSADDPLPGTSPVGVGLDPDRRIWAVNQGSNTATMIDPDSGEVDEVPTGETPYTYSDFTGFALRTFTAPDGYVRDVIEGCRTGPTEWEQLRFDAAVPARSALELRLRTAPTREGLSDAGWRGPWRSTPADLLEPPGPLPTERLLEVEARLVSEDGETTPRLRSVTVRYHCPDER